MPQTHAPTCPFKQEAKLEQRTDQFTISQITPMFLSCCVAFLVVFFIEGWFRLLTNEMREGPVVLLNTCLTSNKARVEQLDDLRRLLMVESIRKILCVGDETREEKKRKKGVKDRRYKRKTVIDCVSRRKHAAVLQ
jgi:hypothetical protein